MPTQAIAPLFRILGPFEMWHDGRLVEIRAAKLRAVLAVLLLRANETVPVADLIDQVWSGAPPESARTTVQAYVYRLRRLLPSGAGAGLHTRGTGYLLAVAADAVDLHHFDALVAEGRRLLADGRLGEGAARLRAGLALWRGPAVGGLPDCALAADIQRLEGYRLLVAEEYLQTQLALGRHAAVLPELHAAVAAHPYSEKLWEWLMLALYRCGRRAEALTAYREARATLVADLGVEPGGELRALHRAILAGQDPLRLAPAVAAGGDAAPAAGGPAPADAAGASAPAARAAAPARAASMELPADVACFTGRRAQVAQLRRMIAQPRGGGASVSVISGMGGVGKSALAVHIAHALAPQFPDGTLYAGLQGWRVGSRPLSPARVLGRWLRSLGVPAQDLPDSTEEAAALFRALTAGRRLLVVLDNAQSAAQVRPLLPAARTCAALVTSRPRLSTLDNAAHLHLGPLDRPEAVRLLGRLIGPARVERELAGAATVVRQCGYLPLAIRIAACRLADRPDRPLSRFAHRLADERGRLDELQHSDLAVRASLQASVAGLRGDPAGRQATQVLAALGLLTGAHVTLSDAAALAGVPSAAADAALELLVDAQLLTAQGGSGTYHIPDLVRLYAAELARSGESALQRRSALRRLAGVRQRTG
ncbi:MAG TPA: BTAD domain-containing putative transcriptional regulator [Pilimelia sp.]|nr:BTAD domain-containing putative transcriptional regulator [Pilimelia sp.]